MLNQFKTIAVDSKYKSRAWCKYVYDFNHYTMKSCYSWRGYGVNSKYKITMITVQVCKTGADCEAIGDSCKA